MFRFYLLLFGFWFLFFKLKLFLEITVTFFKDKLIIRRYTLLEQILKNLNMYFLWKLPPSIEF